MGQSLSTSKRVHDTLTKSQEFNTAVETVYAECLTLTQHAFPGVLPYQLHSATTSIHTHLCLSYPLSLIKNWVPHPPSQSQVDRAFKAAVPSSSSGPLQVLGIDEFRVFAAAVFGEVVVGNVRKALLTRVPVGVAGIAGLGLVTRSGKDLVGSVIGVYALGVATSIFLSLSG